MMKYWWIIILMFMGSVGFSVGLYAQAQEEEDVWNPNVRPSYSANSTEVSKASVRAFTDLVNENALEFQNVPSRPQIVSGNGAPSDSDRLKKPLLFIFGAIGLFVVVVLATLNYILVRVSRQVYRTRLEAVQEHEVGHLKEENEWEKAYRRDRERLQKYRDVDWDD
ncbi:MAG: hypothetical protein Q4D98_03705 [Planctomycetia bacterium]|nr:hypothetical protein [Planctomycetia bacterium]